MPIGHRKLAVCVLFALSADTLRALEPSQATIQNPAPAAPAMEEVEVTGVRPGPGLWRVSRGDHVLWLLGTLDPLPRKMVWRSTEVESVMAQAQEVLYDQPSVSVHGNPFTWITAYFRWRHVQTMPGETTLKDWIGPDLYARFAALEARFDAHDRRTERLRPVFAALRLYGRALDASYLTPGNQTEEAVLKLARRHGVAVQRPQVSVDDPEALIAQLGEVSRDAHASCLAAVVDRLESGLEPMKVAARAWAVGDVETLRQLPHPQDIEVCTDVVAAAPRMKALIGQTASGWDREFAGALEHNRTTLAMRPIYDLLGPDGLLAKLRLEGYQVEGP